MPSPWVPPDPDLPKPIRWQTSDSFSAFALRLKGMSPHDEQYLHEFWLESKRIGVMMLHRIPGGSGADKYHYVGVGIGDLGYLGSASNAVLKVACPGATAKSTVATVKTVTWNA